MHLLNLALLHVVGGTFRRPWYLNLLGRLRSFRRGAVAFATPDAHDSDGLLAASRAVPAQEHEDHKHHDGQYNDASDNKPPDMRCAAAARRIAALATKI